MWDIRYFLYYIVLLTQSYAAIIHSGDTEMEVKTNAGAYFEEKTGVTAYETTAKMLFRVPLPRINFQFMACDQGGDDFICEARITAGQIHDELMSFLQESNVIPKRQKRQVFVGAALGAGIAMLVNSIYTKFSHKLFGTDADADRHIQLIHKAMEINQKEHLIFKNAIQEVAKTVNQSATPNMVTRWDSRTKELLFLTQLQYAVARVHHGVDRCLQNKIPTQFVDSKLLVQLLNTISQNISEYGYSLAIPVNNFHQYYKLDIADCFLTNTTVHILVNVPLTRLNWRLYDVHLVPFAFHNQTCQLQTMSPLLATSNHRVETVSLSSTCDLQKSQMCMIPTYSGSSPTCAYQLFQNSNLDVLSSVCHVRCEYHNLLTVTNIGSNRLIVTNGKSLKIECKTKTHVYAMPAVGAAEITLNCDCNYTVDNKKIDHLYYCSVSTFFNYNANVVIPYFWTNPLNVSTRSYIPDNKWQNMLPNITSVDQVDSAVGINEFIQNVHYRDWWLSANSIIIILLALFCVLRCYCICRK